MVGSALALSLIGLSAVQALPAGKPLEVRQGTISIGGGSATLTPGQGDLPPCLTGVPVDQQPPCLLPPIVGGLNPPKEKREAEAPTAVRKRQVLGGGTGTLTPGQGGLPPCLTNVPISAQPPCILTPLPGGIIPGQGGLPQCLTNVPISEQPPCILAPLPGGIIPPTTPKAKRQESIGDGTGTFTPGQGSLPECSTTVALSDQPPCVLVPIPGGLNPPAIRREKREFVLPPDYRTNTKEVIEELELDLIALQNKNPKSQDDLDLIDDIKAALQYLAGIASISAPPGSGSTFTPGKRNFVLPPDALSNPKRVIAELELKLEALQNKEPKTQDDLDEIDAIKAALLYIAGVTNISAPPGTGSTFTPGKRGIIPGSPIPGGPIVPDHTIPGSPMVPDPAVPGSPITPSTRRRAFRA